jgi:hypothetical protein
MSASLRRKSARTRMEDSPSPVYGAALLMRFGSDPIRGSNPRSSAEPCSLAWRPASRSVHLPGGRPPVPPEAGLQPANRAGVVALFSRPVSPADRIGHGPRASWRERGSFRSRGAPNPPRSWSKAMLQRPNGTRSASTATSERCPPPGSPGRDSRRSRPRSPGRTAGLLQGGLQVNLAESPTVRSEQRS